MNQIMQGKPLTIFGDGEQTRAFTYVGDIAPVIAVATHTTKAYGHIFNIGADRPYSVNHLAQTVGEAMNLTPQLTYLDARNEVVHAYSSHEKVRRFFDYPKETSLTDGLNRIEDRQAIQRN
jgi:UDP-glucose 4-epimerase